MKPMIKIATARTPDGGEMVLYRHDRDYTIKINGQDLMNSRRHASELALASLGCAHLTGHKAPVVLIGGLGLGYTLRQVLDMLGPGARVEVGELLEAVVEWNREYIGELTGRPLSDERVLVRTGDIVDMIAGASKKYDAILIDIDNSPDAMTDAGNSRLYGYEGIDACRRALRHGGCLAVWSATASRAFEQIMTGCGFHVRRFWVPAHTGSKSKTYLIWVAALDERILPPADGEAHRQTTTASGRA